MMQEQHLRVFKYNPKLLKSTCTFITNNFCLLFYVNEIVMLVSYTVDNIHAIYIASVIFLCMVVLKTPIDAQSNITGLTVLYSL
jgi:hypothetical protein